MNHTKEYIAEQAVTLFLKSEVGDYSHFEDWKIDFLDEYDGESTFIVHVDFKERSRCLEFKVDTSKITLDEDGDDYTGKIEVCIYEDNYEPVNTYDWTVKYFWMALLKWD